jgi:hypothetical protein
LGPRVIDITKSSRDPYPYFRGMIAEIRLPPEKIFHDQPIRKIGVTANNWDTLYDIGILGSSNLVSPGSLSSQRGSPEPLAASSSP